MFLRRHYLGADEMVDELTVVGQPRRMMTPQFQKWAAYASLAADVTIAIGGGYAIWHALFSKKGGL